MEFLKLGDQEPFARGSHRACFRHPESEDFCVKVMIEDWRVADRRLRAPWFVRTFRRKWYFHENLFEERFYRKLERRIGELAKEFLPQCYGEVMTDKGEALVVDLIRDHDGGVSETLAGYLWEHGLTQECEEGLAQFWKGLERYRIFTRGRPDNVVVQQRADGSCHLYAIDEFGLAQLIPVAQWVQSQAEKRLRKWRRSQEKAIAEALKLRESGQRLTEKGVI